MKIVTILLVIAFSVIALPGSSLPITNPQIVNDDISVEVIDDWTISEKALDLSVMQTLNGPVVLGIDNGDDLIRIWEDGQTSQSITLPSASSGHSWGIACNNSGDTAAEIMVNDFDSYSFYLTDDVGLSWTTEEDPGGKYSRGIDFDGTHYWTVINGYTDELCRFQPGGTAQNWEIPEIGDTQQGSGLTVFPLENGDTGIALAVFDTGVFFFYSWDGSDISYIGSVATPFSDSVLISLGIAYCETTGHFFWTYGPVSGYRMVEFTISFSGQSLSSTTWGSIKNAF